MHDIRLRRIEKSGVTFLREIKDYFLLFKQLPYEYEGERSDFGPLKEKPT